MFEQHELDIVPLKPEDCLVVIGSYTGSTDLTTDKQNADTVLTALFPNRWKVACTENVSANTAAPTAGGGCDDDIEVLVYKNDILLDSSTYTMVKTTATASAFDPVLAGGDVITMTFCKPVYGVDTIEYDVDLPVTTKEIKSAGSTEYVYRSKTYGEADIPITVNGTYDVRKLRRAYPANELEKMLFGAQWVETSAAENEIGRNTNPFFVSVIWWYPSATSGELTIEQMTFYKCDLNKGVFPKYDGQEEAAKYSIDAKATYVYRKKTLVA